MKKYTSLEVLCRERSQQAEKLRKQNKTEESRLQSFKREENQLKASIASIQDNALQNMEEVGQKACQHLATLLARAKEYGELERQAAQLQQQLALARAFMSREREHWAEVSRPMVQQLVYGLIWWALSGDHNRRVVAPSFVVERVPGIRWIEISLVDLMFWTMAGVMTEEEQKLSDSGL
ncbi:hypothetical protein ACFLXA_04235 [Chloroflexota bacterium]